MRLGLLARRGQRRSAGLARAAAEGVGRHLGRRSPSVETGSDARSEASAAADVRHETAVGDDEGERDGEGQHEQGQGARRSHASRSASVGRGRTSRFRDDRSPQIARAVDVRIGQADELLLADRLRDGLVHRRAAIGRIGRLEREPEDVVVVDRAKERADPGVRRSILADRRSGA